MSEANPAPLTINSEPEVNPEPLTLHHEPEVNPEPLTGIYELTLTSPDGRESKTLAFMPTEQTRRNLCLQARKWGLAAELRPINN